MLRRAAVRPPLNTHGYGNTAQTQIPAYAFLLSVRRPRHKNRWTSLRDRLSPQPFLLSFKLEVVTHSFDLILKHTVRHPQIMNARARGLGLVPTPAECRGGLVSRSRRPYVHEAWGRRGQLTYLASRRTGECGHMEGKDRRRHGNQEKKKLIPWGWVSRVGAAPSTYHTYHLGKTKRTNQSNRSYQRFWFLHGAKGGGGGDRQHGWMMAWPGVSPCLFVCLLPPQQAIDR